MKMVAAVSVLLGVVLGVSGALLFQRGGKPAHYATILTTNSPGVFIIPGRVTPLMSAGVARLSTFTYVNLWNHVPETEQYSPVQVSTKSFDEINTSGCEIGTPTSVAGWLPRADGTCFVEDSRRNQ